MGTTLEGIIAINLLKEDEREMKEVQRSCATHREHSSSDVKVMVKQISFLKNNYFERLFYHLRKLTRVRDSPGLLTMKGFCITETEKNSFNLLIIYPRVNIKIIIIS